MTDKKTRFFQEIRSLFVVVIIALLLKVTIIEAYIVPTGSMENTIMTGDFLIGNRFIYGMRTPDWIGIPYTDIGFDIPYLRFPHFRKPEQGDVIIFKYPRDPHVKYVKRCIAGPGDVLEIKARMVTVNGEEFPLPTNGKYLFSMDPETFEHPQIYLGTQGNKDYFKSIRIPSKGDQVAINEETNWRYLLPIIIMDGHKATLENEFIRFEFTTRDPNDLYRRKQSQDIFEEYFPVGRKLTPWTSNIKESDFAFLHVDGVPVSEMDSYTVEQNYYWAMGDNRDDSLDSRYWGFVPEDYILGEALFVYFSLNLKTWVPRFDHIGTVIR